MYVKMDKISEREEEVVYKFSTKIWEKENDDYKLVTKVGVCSFNKENRHFELDKNKTDSYFFNRMHREVIAVRVKLLNLNEEN